MAQPLYLDGFSTTPLAPEARHALLAALDSTGNPSSPHGAGQRAARLIEDARSDVATLIGASPAEIHFTSGATEANNLALIGVARALREQGTERTHILVSAVEHKAVLEPAHALTGEGFEVLTAPVDRFGRLDFAAYRALLDKRVLLASVMAVNNETGVIQPIGEAAAAAHEVGALFHSDAAQAASKLPLEVAELDVDYLSVSAHKLYGPMGIGALYIAASAPKPAPLFYGGGQQEGLRPGTEPVALIASFGAAAKLAAKRLGADADHGRRLATMFLDELAARQVRFSLVTKNQETVPGSLSIRIDGIDADHLCAVLADKVHMSTGSACTSGQLRTSHVLEAMGFSNEEAAQVVRAFCHRYLDADDIRSAAAEVAAAVRQSAVATGGGLQ
nr:cysteine desulfurase [Sphingomonas sp.]